jgi:hypothetical protein
LAQLKELEDLRVQLTLPGADPQVLGEADSAGDVAPLDAAADDDDEPESASEQDSDSETPRQQGLVASGAQDDAN